MRGRFGLALRGQLNQPRNVHFHRRRSARQAVLNAHKARLRIALSPTRDLDAANPQLLHDFLVLHSVARQQHNLSTLCQPDAGELGANQSVQLRSLVFGQHDLWRNSHVQISAPHAMYIGVAKHKYVPSRMQHYTS